MQLTVTSVDYAPDELYEQAPFVVDLLRPMASADGPKYWLGAVQRPIRWVVDGAEREITHVVVSARWVGDRIGRGVRTMPLNIAYVTDASLLEDAQVTAAKIAFVAIGLCDETGPGR